MKIRGIATIFLIGAYFVIVDVIERTIITAWIRLRPSHRDRVLTAWARVLSRTTLAIVSRTGGATFGHIPRLPAGPGVLVLMNHQSLLDIPLAFEMFGGGYPRFVTRKRYARGIPLVSHMLRLYDHPLVEPGTGNDRQLQELREMAAESSRPVLIFPEGSRTRDGEIRPFKTRGLEAILAARNWSVYLVVVDGLWRSARLGDFVRNVHSIRATAESIGPIEYDRESDDINRFIKQLYRQMRKKLQAMREVRSRTVTR